MTLAQFQDRFARALCGTGESSVALDHLMHQPGFAIYRNTVMKGCIDALQGNYPAVARLVGDEWFRAAAAVYVQQHRPRDPRLLLYGDSFAGFLDAFEPAQALPYLSGVARLDRFWSEAHTAGDETVLDAAALSSVAAQDYTRLILHPHAAARWLWCDAYPVFSIWQQNRAASAEVDGSFPWRGEGALLVRTRHVVEWHPLDAASCAFLNACRNGDALTDAAAAALAASPDTDLARLLAMLLQLGAFSRMERRDTSLVKDRS